MPQLSADDARFSAPLTLLQSLRSFSTQLLAIHTVDEVARALMTDGVGAAGATGGSLMIVQGTRLQMISERNLGDDITTAWNDFDIRPGLDPISDALTDQTPAFYPDRAGLLLAYPHLQDTIEPTPHHAWVVLPLLHEGLPIGSLGFTYEQPQQFGTAEQLALLTIADLATQAVIRVLSAVEARQAFESLHAALLDLEVPQLEGVTTATAHLTAAKTSEAGGDWFNATELADGHLLFVIGDVAHHGTAAVGEMGRIRAVVLAYAVEEHPTNRIADLTTLTLSKLSSTFATACIVLYDPTHADAQLDECRPSVSGDRSGIGCCVPAGGHPRTATRRGDRGLLRTKCSHLGPRRHRAALLGWPDRTARTRHRRDFARLLDAIPLDAERPAGLVDEVLGRLHPTGLHDDDIAVLAITVD